ncbi:unnamed protein product [Citrullus colocynthis]|uniref:Uncharacterized protein n=1 Tax=Citrullus colocynthis TaxID=252529 RepID=A0ABP0Y3I4_9ROSI
MSTSTNGGGEPQVLEIDIKDSDSRWNNGRQACILQVDLIGSHASRTDIRRLFVSSKSLWAAL